jgi:putative addiction module component (TIGR02574 family)
MASPLLEVVRLLPPDERMQLVEDIWDTLVDDLAVLPVTAAQAEELDLRLEAYAKDGNPGIPWEQLKAELRAEM